MKSITPNLSVHTPRMYVSSRLGSSCTASNTNNSPFLLSPRVPEIQVPQVQNPEQCASKIEFTVDKSELL